MAIIHGTDDTENLDYDDGITDGADTIHGHGGNDRIYAHGGNDTINGNNGDDMIIGGAGADAIDGGNGNDTANYHTSAAGVTVSLSTGAGLGGEAQGDTLDEIENLVGSDHNDSLIGDGGANTLTGRDGDDLLWGGGGGDTLLGDDGNDTLKGGGGADHLVGGAGTDIAAYVESNAGVFVSLIDDTASGGEAQGDELDGIEILVGSNHADGLSGDNGSNRLDGQGGNDTLMGYGGADGLYGGAGADALYGMDGQDVLRGEAGADWLEGGNGNDQLLGGGGSDTLMGGVGNDTLTGGDGPDAFVFHTALNAATNVDEVTDFDVAEDMLHLDDLVAFPELPAGMLAAHAFRIGEEAMDGNDRIIYNSETGALIYDADGQGAGAAVQFAQLDIGLALTHNDFLIV
jgi:Ca2+-binding RTX toxin-like protein